MRILFVSPRQCWPSMGGSKLREYHFLRALGEHESVTYLFFRDPVFEAPKPADLPFCERLLHIPAPESYSLGSLLRGVVGQWPLPVLQYTSDSMKAALADCLRDNSYDVVHLEGVHLAAYVPFLQQLAPKRPIIISWHNIESEAMERYAELSSFPKRIYAKLTAKRLFSLENDLLGNAQGHFVCSQREKVQLAEWNSQARVAVAENGVDTTIFKATNILEARNRILFVGLMAYHANADGAVWFTREVWPLLRQRMPEKQLTIVGANPTPAVLELRNEPGVEVTGTVPKVEPFYQEAFAAIVPLRVGAGTRLKILEAMAAGVPVISSRIGAEGLQVQPGENILFAETPEEWIQALETLQNPERWHSLTAAARTLVCSRYDWSVIRESVYGTYSAWLEEHLASVQRDKAGINAG